MTPKIVLAYSGGLDTSVMIPWLKDHYQCEVIAMCADLGQDDELSGLEEKALASGAAAFFLEDLKELFITDFIYPTIKSGAIYESKYLLGTSFGRPLIAQRMVEIAQREGATMVAHGATGKGNDQVRFELTFLALDPSLKIIAPWKDDQWTLRSREDCLAYAAEKGIPVTQSVARIYSEDRNIWHISHEGGGLEDPSIEPSPDVFTLSNRLEDAPNEPEYVTITFEKGIPVAVDNQALSPVALLQHLNALGSRHAIGQVDLLENRLVGIKSRGIYETPGGTILYEAHRNLEQLVLDRDTLHYKQRLALEYADLVYDGRWFTPLKSAMDAFIEQTQTVVSGDVRLKLYKGNVVPAGSTSPYSLYREALSSFTDSEMYNQKDAIGFINIYGLPLKVNGLRNRGEL